ncbi:kynureninase [Salinimonas sediminis]|uniref:Kynureninase n=1 Tax=Salinimonas sediminis TaxID=2303538 RepID=A0A346NLB4_9ALTE|nr:kynureninase [Salinimonas sediminis]AXR06321.1 kynureninase [Salinimonas sediminis]
MSYNIAQLDKQDVLAPKRALFNLPEEVIYLDGNSLGALPKASVERIQQVVNQQWGNDLISSWNKHNWIDLPLQTGEKIAPLLGAGPDQVVVCDSISVNLYKLLITALTMQSGRAKVVSEQDNFPTDLYMVQGVQTLLGETRCQLISVASEDIENALTDDVAVLMLTHINFRTGRIHDMQRLTRLAHQKGIIVIWDLAHSAGAVPLALDECNVDFAVGCGYKYLNGGPGAPAFLYAAKRHHNKISQPLNGWMGHAKPFEFSPRYDAAPGIKQFLTGTPSIIAMAALDAALDVFDSVSMAQIRQKSSALTELFLHLKRQHPALDDLVLCSPTDSELRGSQLSFSHPAAYAICQALIDHNVVPDFRAPDIVRFGFTPLYLSFADVAKAIAVLHNIMQQRLYTHNKYRTKAAVT